MPVLSQHIGAETHASLVLLFCLLQSVESLDYQTRAGNSDHSRVCILAILVFQTRCYQIQTDITHALGEGCTSLPLTINNQDCQNPRLERQHGHHLELSEESLVGKHLAQAQTLCKLSYISRHPTRKCYPILLFLSQLLYVHHPLLPFTASMPLELILSNSSTHRGSRADPTSQHGQHRVDIARARPLLMRHDIVLAVHLGLLNHLTIRPHAVLSVGSGEVVRDEGVGMQASEGDELPAVAELAEALNVRLLLVAGHGGLPVEGGGEVVGESVSYVSRAGFRGEGERTHFCSGHTACTPSANSCAWA